jgi:dimethylaniline monooxygenase (N-oxide forming)
MWRYGNDNGLSCAYRSLHIDTSRNNLGYSDFPIPADKPDFLSHQQLLNYLEAYADRFGARSRIRFNCEVTSVEKTDDGWRVTTKEGTREYKTVIVANGHLWDPRWPTFSGTFNGTAIHSSQYRTAQPFEDKKVLVVGIGNSAVDIAVDLCKRASSVVLSTRTGAYIMPKYMMGIPIDRWSAFFARKLKFPTLLTRMIMARLIYLAVGDQTRFGVPKPKHPMWREHATLSQELLPYIGHGWISIKPNVTALEGDSHRFRRRHAGELRRGDLRHRLQDQLSVPRARDLLGAGRRRHGRSLSTHHAAEPARPVLCRIGAAHRTDHSAGRNPGPMDRSRAHRQSRPAQPRRYGAGGPRLSPEEDQHLAELRALYAGSRFQDYAGELNGDIAKAASGRPAAVASA